MHAPYIHQESEQHGQAAALHQRFIYINVNAFSSRAVTDAVAAAAADRTCVKMCIEEDVSRHSKTTADFVVLCITHTRARFIKSSTPRGMRSVIARSLDGVLHARTRVVKSCPVVLFEYIGDKRVGEKYIILIIVQ